MQIWTKRAYARPSKADGQRILVDRMWPRGVKKEEADIDIWLRELAPSDELRQWFDHRPERWEEFKQRYFEELQDHEDKVEELLEMGAHRRLTLVYAANDDEHNNAVALREYLQDHMLAG